YVYNDGSAKVVSISERLNGTEIGTRKYEDGLLTERTWAWGLGASAKETRSYTGGVLTGSTMDTGPSGALTRGYTYDSEGRLTDVSNNGAPEQHLDLDADGRVLSRTDHNGLVTTIRYDKLGRPVVWNYGGNDEVRVERDAQNGAVTAHIEG